MRSVRVLVAVGVIVGCCASVFGAGANASGIRKVRFTATLDGSVTTTWSVPEQLLSSTCYDDMWQRGQGTEHITVHMSATKALGVVYSGKSFTLSLGSWQLYHGGAHARENRSRQGQVITFHRPGNCGRGGTAPPSREGPGGCGDRSGTPEVSLTQLGSNHKWQAYVTDTRNQIKDYTDCPMYYGSVDAPGTLLTPVLGRFSIKDLLNAKKRHITLHFQRRWHHGRGSAVTNYFIADTTSSWTLQLTRQ